MKATAGDSIVCGCGHEAGAFINGVEDGSPVSRIDFALFSFSPTIEGTCLRCKRCEAPIAETVGVDRWRIHGRDGWIV